MATTNEYSNWRLRRVGLTLDDAIEEELWDYQRARAACRESGADFGHLAGEPDVTLWEGDRCLAVIRYRADGEPEVTRFDHGYGDKLAS